MARPGAVADVLFANFARDSSKVRGSDSVSAAEADARSNSGVVDRVEGAEVSKRLS